MKTKKFMLSVVLEILTWLTIIVSLIVDPFARLFKYLAKWRRAVRYDIRLSALHFLKKTLSDE